jgi:hypothetical protein
VRTTNDEMLTPRELRRALTEHLERLDEGVVEKLILMQGGKMKYVVVPVAKYEDLTNPPKPFEPR